MNTTSLIQAIALVEDIQKNGEGLDAKVLIEAMNITEEDLSAPMSGEDLLLELLG